MNFASIAGTAGFLEKPEGLKTIVVRAHNEESTIGRTVRDLIDGVGQRVWVAASGCTDETVTLAREAGAEVLITPIGLGASMRTVLTEFVSEPVVLVDGDLGAVRTDVVRVLDAAAREGFVGKGSLDRPGRSSSLLPDLAREAGVDLPDIPPQALTSSYSAFPRGFADAVDLSMVPDQRGSDLMLSLLAHNAGIGTVVVPAGPRDHRDRGEAHVDVLVEGNRRTLAVMAERARDTRLPSV